MATRWVAGGVIGVIGVVGVGLGAAAHAAIPSSLTQIDLGCLSSENPNLVRTDLDEDEDCKEVLKVRPSMIPMITRPNQESTSIHDPPALVFELDGDLGIAAWTADGEYSFVVEGLSEPDLDTPQLAVLDLDGDGRSEVVWVDGDTMRVWYEVDPGQVRQGQSPDATIGLPGKVSLAADRGDQDVLLVTTDNGTTEISGSVHDLPGSID